WSTTRRKRPRHHLRVRFSWHGRRRAREETWRSAKRQSRLETESDGAGRRRQCANHPENACRSRRRRRRAERLCQLRNLGRGFEEADGGVTIPRHVMAVLGGGHPEQLVQTLASVALDGGVKPGHGVGMVAGGISLAMRPLRSSRA